MWLEPLALAASASAAPRLRIEFWSILGCVLLLVAVLELMRRDRLKERYALLWLGTVGVLFAFALKRSWLEDLAAVAGIHYPPTALLLVLIVFMLVLLVHFSTAITGLLNDKQRLAQEIGLLESRVRELERRAATQASEPGPPRDA